ncbi:MAG: hypothetical protein FWD05_07250 [Oscillospiraceae bacterium]|nr:hypothetical protein [Oscillospiraceae bacterium]
MATKNRLCCLCNRGGRGFAVFCNFGEEVDIRVPSHKNQQAKFPNHRLTCIYKFELKLSLKLNNPTFQQMPGVRVALIKSNLTGLVAQNQNFTY